MCPKIEEWWNKKEEFASSSNTNTDPATPVAPNASKPKF
jgi:hypothetical protein